MKGQKGLLNLGKCNIERICVRNQTRVILPGREAKVSYWCREPDFIIWS